MSADDNFGLTSAEQALVRAFRLMSAVDAQSIFGLAEVCAENHQEKVKRELPHGPQLRLVRGGRRVS